jgi:hypothetical protein
MPPSRLTIAKGGTGQQLGDLDGAAPLRRLSLQLNRIKPVAVRHAAGGR